MDALSKILALLFSIITALGILPKTIPADVTLPRLEGDDVVFSTDCYDFGYDNGRFSIALDGRTMFSDAVSEVRLNDKTISSASYEGFSLETVAVNDVRGKGTSLTATLEGAGLPIMKQHFTFYDDAKYFLISTELVAQEGEVASNYIAPIVIRHGNIQNSAPRYHGGNPE